MFLIEMSAKVPAGAVGLGVRAAGGAFTGTKLSISSLLMCQSGPEPGQLASRLPEHLPECCRAAAASGVRVGAVAPVAAASPGAGGGVESSGIPA